MWMERAPSTSSLSFCLLKHVFGFFKQVAEDVFAVLFALFFVKTGKIFEQVFLLHAQVSGRDDFDDDVLIAARAAMHDRHTHTLEAARTVAMCASRNLEGG